jgi:hydrogenase nickel incorporation protein HypB
LPRLEQRVPCVIEGDPATSRDADRIRATGSRVFQINTGEGCHLDADMVAIGLEELAPKRGSIVFVENVGNLVCPPLVDLGERAKIVVLSVTEGEDKPLKYPRAFQAAEACVLTKLDLLPHLDFDLESAIRAAREVNPRLQLFHTSTRTPQTLDPLVDWLDGLLPPRPRASKGAAQWLP